MRLLRALFGPSKEEVWTQLAQNVEGRFVDGGLFSGDAVQARAGDWIITLDTYTQSTGNSSTTYTRMQAPYVNPKGVRFKIYRAGLFSGVGKRMGMQDIEVGDHDFDKDFIIKGNSERSVRRLFANSKIRGLIAQQPRVSLSVRDDEGWFAATFPDGVDELYFTAVGVIKHPAQLRSLFELFSEVLNQLCHEGKAYEDDIDLLIERLRWPGGRIESKLLLWEGDEPRREAARALGRLADAKAVPVLVSVLRDPDDVVRARAVEALSAIADERAVGPLLQLLGDSGSMDEQLLRDRAADALLEMGERGVVEATRESLEGRHELLKEYRGTHLASVVIALTDALDGSSAVHAAEALAAIHAVEALPRLRETLSRTGRPPKRWSRPSRRWNHVRRCRVQRPAT